MTQVSENMHDTRWYQILRVVLQPIYYEVLWGRCVEGQKVGDLSSYTHIPIDLLVVNASKTGS